MHIIHISAECYPAAKTGGLADVVGALPKYQNQLGVRASVVLPAYGTDWIMNQTSEEVWHGWLDMGGPHEEFWIQKLTHSTLGFDLFLVRIPKYFDRPGVYAAPEGEFYRDEAERYIAFQRAVLEWIKGMTSRPDIVHCHDHHAGLVPFLMKYSVAYGELRHIPTVFTIHNGKYHGAFRWDDISQIGPYYENERGYLDWQGVVHPMASAIRCCWALTTVSPSYLEELQGEEQGIGDLISSMQHKSHGLLNGIDAQVWNPRDDIYLEHHLVDDISDWKERNKASLCADFGFDIRAPLISYIGRMAREKGAYILPDVYRSAIQSGYKLSFLTLGSGDEHLTQRLGDLKGQFPGRVDDYIGYNEGLAHRIYAGSDFLLMPSEVEPCGLNQMYAMSYGTIPIVRKVGGLRDTVPDIGDGGVGFTFNHVRADDIVPSIHRAVHLYENKDQLTELREKIMQQDYSWERMTEIYIDVYRSLIRH